MSPASRACFRICEIFSPSGPLRFGPGTATAFDMPKFGTGLRANLQEFFRAAPRGSVNSALLVNWNEEPTLWQNLRDLFSPPKTAPAADHQPAYSRSRNLVEEHAIHPRAGCFRFLSMRCDCARGADSAAAAGLISPPHDESLQPSAASRRERFALSCEACSRPLRRRAVVAGQHDLAPAAKGQAAEIFMDADSRRRWCIRRSIRKSR